MKFEISFLTLAIVIFSCTYKSNSVDHSPIDTLTNSSDFFFTEFLDKKSEEDSLEYIVSQAIRNISLETHSILKEELEAIYFRDQVFRDSLQLYSNNVGEKREFGKKMKQSDYINQKIVLSIFENYGWVDTRKMSKMASEGIWITIIHCSDNKYLNQEALKYVNIAFYEDSIITNRIFATATDRIHLRLQGKSIYGTSAFFGTKKEYDLCFG